MDEFRQLVTKNTLKSRMKKRKALASCSYVTAFRGGSEDSALTALSVTKIDLPQQILRVVISVLSFLSYHTFIISR